MYIAYERMIHISGLIFMALLVNTQKNDTMMNNAFRDLLING